MSRQTEPDRVTPGGDSPPALWDPVVRLTHWGVAMAVLLNAVVTDGGSVPHVWIGWIALSLLLLRLLWGVAGPVEARFASFPPAPRAALAHLRALAAGRPARHPSHNPAGAIMVYAFWAALAVVTVTGVLVTGSGPVGVMEAKAAAERGDWAAVAAHRPVLGKDMTKLAKGVHGVTANLILILAALHVAGVAVESRRMRADLLRPMLFGARPPK